MDQTRSKFRLIKYIPDGSLYLFNDTTPLAEFTAEEWSWMVANPELVEGNEEEEMEEHETTAV